MSRIQVDRLNKNLRDLTVLKTLNSEGYSLKLKHIASISGDLSPEEVESTLKKRYSYSKGKPLLKVFIEDFKKLTKRLGL